MRPGIKKIVLLSFIIAFSWLVLLSIYVYRNFQHNLQITRENNATLNVLGSLGRLFDDMKDLETGYSGYLINGKENFLEPYHQGINRYQEDLNKVKSSIAADAPELFYFKELETFAARKVALAKNIVASYRASGPSVNEINLVDQGKKIMDSIRIFNALIQEKEHA